MTQQEKTNQLSSLSENELLETAHQHLLEGNKFSDIAEFFEQEGIEPEKIKEILTAALNKFSDATKRPDDIMRGWCMEVYQNLYKKLLETGDYAGALKAVSEISKLSGLQKKSGGSATDYLELIKSY